MPLIKSAFEKRKPLGDSIHRAIMNKFRLYMTVGGMPQAANIDIHRTDRRKKNNMKLILDFASRIEKC